LLYTKSFAQNYFFEPKKGSVSFEYGMGAAGYDGDLMEKATPFNQADLATSLGLQYHLTNQFSPILTASFMRIGADDKKNNDPLLRARNLNFKSLVWDVNAGFQFNFLNPATMRLSPYVYAGVGVFHFNPYTIDRNGEKRMLQPMGTEGQRLSSPTQAPYKLIQMQVPFGGGFSFDVDEQISVKFDLVIRKIFTDYLDDVSTGYVDPDLLAEQDPGLPYLAFRGDEVKQTATYPGPTDQRGNPGKNDWYYTALLKLAYRL
jgi:hypothetical protein